MEELARCPGIGEAKVIQNANFFFKNLLGRRIFWFVEYRKDFIVCR